MEKPSGPAGPARACGINAPWIGYGSRISPICGARKAGAMCAARDAHSRRVLGYATGEPQSTDLVITALDMAATTRGVFPVGVVLHADPGTQFTSEKLAAYVPAAQGTVSMGRAGVCWDSAMAESIAYPQNRVLLPLYLHHTRPGLHRGHHLDRRLLQPPPHPHQPRRQNPRSKTNYTKRPGQQRHKQTANNLRTTREQ